MPLIDAQRARARRHSSALEIQRARAELAGWLKVRRASDVRQQYVTQLAAIEKLVGGAFDDLQGALSHVAPDGPLERVYGDCHKFDRRLVWVRRVWDFYRDKFDQRDTALGPVLQAADEVVWSCFREVDRRVENAGIAGGLGPAPLPFVEYAFSPAAFPAQRVPPELRTEVDGEFLSRVLEQLPVPIVRIPPRCVDSPWWLVLLAHEVGHHVQYGLDQATALRSEFAELLRQAVEADGAEFEECERWSSWSEEIFADAFSIRMVGPSAVRAMLELEWLDDESMTQRRAGYPPACVRLALLAALGQSAGVAGDAALAGYDAGAAAATDADCARYLARIDALVVAIDATLPGLDQSWSSLTGFQARDFSVTGVIAECISGLRGRSQEPIEATLRQARRLAAASLGGFIELLEERDDAAREAAGAALKERTIRCIRASAEAGTRDSRGASTTRVAQARKVLIDELMGADAAFLES